MLTTALTMIAFAAIYAALLTMVGQRLPDLAAALLRRPVQLGGSPLAASASRRLSRA